MKKSQIFLPLLLVYLAMIPHSVMGRQFGYDIYQAENEKENVLLYDENHILNIGMHNINSFYNMVQDKSNATIVLLIYAPWCGYSQQFLPEFDLLARNMHKDGEKDLYFVKIDGDKEVALNQKFDVQGFPTIYLQQVINGEVKDLIVYDGERSAFHLLASIREIKPFEPEFITTTERYNELRNTISHHLVLGLFNKETSEHVRGTLKRLSEYNQFIKFAYVENQEIIPGNIRQEAKSEIVVVNHPIIEDYFLLQDVDIHREFEVTNENLQKSLKSKIGYMDLANIGLYANFENPIVAIASTHPTINDIGKNAEFYKVVVKFLFDGGYKNHPDFDYVILNANDVKDVNYDLQLNLVEQRNFYLIILKDQDTGYRYDNIIIREEENQPLVRTAETINQYISDYKSNKLRPYLKSETQKTDPAFIDGILQIYGSNYLDLVLKRRQEKPMFLMLTKMNCPLCDQLEVYFEKLSKIYTQFQFARMDIEKNYPASDLRNVIYEQEMPQFFMVQTSEVKEQFARIHNSYDEMRSFLDRMIRSNDEQLYQEL